MKNLEEITLKVGGHNSPEDGMCVMEAVSYLRGEPFSDKPTCVCPVIAAFLRRWNDDLPDADRDRLLKPLILECVGTRADAATERRRSYMAIDWFIREYLPAWLDATPSLVPHAATCRALDPIVDLPSLQAVENVLDAARAAAEAAAWDAAEAAAWDAARDAARAAAWAAAWAAAGDAAGAAPYKILAPITASIQESAVKLVRRMIAVQP